MDNFAIAVWNRLYYDGGHIVAEIDATKSDHFRWIAIYKMKKEHPLSPFANNSGKYSIFDFELRKELLDEYFADSDMLQQKRYSVESEAQLLSLLEDIGILPSKFNYPWKCSFPL